MILCACVNECTVSCAHQYAWLDVWMCVRFVRVIGDVCARKRFAVYPSMMCEWVWVDVFFQLRFPGRICTVCVENSVKFWFKVVLMLILSPLHVLSLMTPINFHNRLLLFFMIILSSLPPQELCFPRLPFMFYPSHKCNLYKNRLSINSAF